MSDSRDRIKECDENFLKGVVGFGDIMLEGIWSSE